MAEVAKMLSIIDLDGKYNELINNNNIDVTKDFRLTSIKKY